MAPRKKPIIAGQNPTQEPRIKKPLEDRDRLELAASRAKQQGIPEPALTPQGEFTTVIEQEARQQAQAEAVRAEAETKITEEKFTGATGEALAQKFGEAGVFEQPVLVPIISPEQENAGVLLDMATSLFKFRKEAEGLSEIFRGKEDDAAIRRRLAEERVSETELAVIAAQIDDKVKSEITATYDDEIEATVVEMGLGVGVITGAVVGGFVGSASQLIGTDKKVKNLATGVVKLETLTTSIASTVESGDMDKDEGTRRILLIETIVDNFEAELQLAAIDSANVRISLKGRDISVKIFSSRERSNEAKKKIAGFEIAGLIENSPTHQKISLMNDLQKQFEGSQ